MWGEVGGIVEGCGGQLGHLGEECRGEATQGDEIG